MTFKPLTSSSMIQISGSKSGLPLWIDSWKIPMSRDSPPTQLHIKSSKRRRHFSRRTSKLSMWRSVKRKFIIYFISLLKCQIDFNPLNNYTSQTLTISVTNLRIFIIFNLNFKLTALIKKNSTDSAEVAASIRALKCKIDDNKAFAQDSASSNAVKFSNLGI